MYPHHALTKDSETNKEGPRSLELLSEVLLDWVRIPVSWSQVTNHQEAAWLRATHITSSSQFPHLKHVLVPDLKITHLGTHIKTIKAMKNVSPACS